jgi:hypothetical protein
MKKGIAILWFCLLRFIMNHPQDIANKNIFNSLMNCLFPVKQRVMTILIGLTVFIYSISFSQGNRSIDSLKNNVIVKSGLEKYQPLIDLGVEYFHRGDHRCLEYFGQARDVAIQCGDSSKIVKANRLAADKHRTLLY